MLALAGCVAMAKVEKGERAIGDRLAVKIEGAWNQLDGPELGPAQTWTMEGLPIDQLLLYSGVKDGDLVHASGGDGKRKDFAFKANMQADEIVGMFEGMLTRDGSSFKLTRLEPSSFGGLSGFHFEYTLIRKVDNVVLTGVGWGAVSKGELFAMLYMAPRLAFFARHAADVERIAMSAKIRQSAQ
ncbi:MAG: hypothetical protein A3H32_04215 [Betaproteobacteria bacterium RIFCSPLOWO2_02_FULL_63_19]|nr:MAG: hypothetical protein A3H32_04215 [Betaproteobacteria bacterium RIFCSPLOWO2_02_FULL_63_19]